MRGRIHCYPIEGNRAASPVTTTVGTIAAASVSKAFKVRVRVRVRVREKI
jgi:hypothetical protein